MKKPLIQLMKEAGLEWPAEANFAAQDKWCNAVYFYVYKPRAPKKEDNIWSYPENEGYSVDRYELPERCKKWRKTLITKEEYLGTD